MNIKHTAEKITYLAEKISNLHETEEDAKKFILHEINCLVRNLVESIDSIENEKIETLESKLSASIVEVNWLQKSIGIRDKKLEFYKSTQDYFRYYKDRIAELNAQIRSLRKKLREVNFYAKGKKPVIPEEYYQSVLLKKSKNLTEYMSNTYGDAPQPQPLASKHGIPPSPPPKRDNAVGVSPMSDCRKKRSRLFDW